MKKQIIRETKKLYIMTKIIFFMSILFSAGVVTYPLEGFCQTPIIAFSDLTDGPKTGWQGSTTKGAAVTIWGLGFGTTRGSSTVTVGGRTLSSDSDYAEWGTKTNPTTARDLQRITFYLNSSMNTGATTIKVTVGGVESNSIPFYCRDLGSSHIYYLSPTAGDDTSGDGSYTKPWATLKKVRTTAVAGDCFYLRAGTYATIDAYNAAMSFYLTYNSGALNNSITVTAYPGEAPQIGDGTVNSGKPRYFVNPDTAASKKDFSYWTFSKLTILMYDRALYCQQTAGASTQTGSRWIGNDIHITSGAVGQGFALNPYGSLTNFYIMGNYFHDCGYGDGSYPVYCIYIGGNFPGQTASYSKNIHIGWNEFYHSSGRGIDVYGHVYQDYIENIYIYNNYLHDMGTVGLVIGAGDPTGGSYANIGTAYIYNNIIQDCKSIAAKITDGSAGSHGGTFHFFNNTLHNNAYAVSTCDFQITGPTLLSMKNNIIFSSSVSNCYVSYYGGTAGGSQGDHNLWYGASGKPSWSTTGDLNNVAPIFSTGFAPASDSPSVGSGVMISSFGAPWDTYDYYGIPRGSSWEIGAIEVANAGTDPAPSTPTGVEVKIID